MPNYAYSKQMILYLRRLYQKSIEENKEVTSGDLAVEAGVRTSSAIDIIKRLEEHGFVDRTLWGPIYLTKKGIIEARKLVYKHRIIETYLCRCLSIKDDVACEEAAFLETQTSERVVYAMCEKLGHPSICIHGRKIPHVHKVKSK
ncbi:MAG: metal-dependent transcriptional regulator [Nitrososphaeria archaeon]